MEIALRPLTRDDIPAWAELLAAVEKVENTGEHYSAADLAEEMDNPDTEVGKDFVGAFDGDEQVGYFSVMPRGETDGTYKVHVEGSVRPDRRGEGIGTAAGRRHGGPRRRRRAGAPPGPAVPADRDRDDHEHRRRRSC